MAQKIGIGILLILLVLVVLNLQLIVYGINQGIGQFKILWDAQPIEKVLKDSTLDLETREKLLLVEEIKTFGKNYIGIDDSGNYSKFYNHGDDAILWVVRGCKPFEFTSKEWKFPIVGSVSYKGYFDLKKAIALKEELDAEGYDTYLREVTAWSTLGWFKDPVLSGMLKRSEGDLANTLIHELTHTNIFIEDELNFNENLASYIGDKGAEYYLTNKYGSNSIELKSYQESRSDRELINNHFLNGYNYLDSLYKTFNSDMDSLYMSTKKEQAILLLVESIDTLNTSTDNNIYKDRFLEYLPNNAYMMSYRVYRGEQTKLDSLYNQKYQNNIKYMFEGLKKMPVDSIILLME